MKIVIKFAGALLEDPATVPKRIASAQCLADSSLTPVALLLTRELMWEEA